MQDLLEGCDLGSLGWSQSPVLSAVWLAEIPDVSWFRMLVGYFWDLKLHFVWQFCWINLNHINQTPWFIVLRSPSCCNPPQSTSNDISKISQFNATKFPTSQMSTAGVAHCCLSPSNIFRLPGSSPQRCAPAAWDRAGLADLGLRSWNDENLRTSRISRENEDIKGISLDIIWYYSGIWNFHGGIVGD